MGNLDYGAVGNCRSAALISAKGSIDWLCFPDFDSPSIFAALLDKEKGGCLSIVVDDDYTISQQYIEHTNILSTLFESKDASFEVLDFMPRYKIYEYQEYYLPPELYRYIRLRRGKPRFKLRYRPQLNYASGKVSHRSGKTYVKTVSETNTRDTIYLYSNLDYEDILNEKSIILEEDAFLLISYNQKLVTIDLPRVRLDYERTKVYWLNWTSRSKKYKMFNKEIERSMLVLKLMSYQQSGAVLAALTTSLPETIGDVRNWDYRFCWLRDASMSIETLMSMGHQGAASRFMDFIHNILRNKGERFQIMYGIRGERKLTEETLDHLEGFKGSKPVRIGNAAYKQKQNDALGYLMDVIYHYYMYFPGTLNQIEDMWEVVKNIVKSVREDWHQPDNGIWEIRGEKSHFVLSKVMCWVAINRAVSVARISNEIHYAERWQALADEIQQEVFTKAWKEDIQSFSQTYENSELDASLLLMESYGFIEGSDPRYQKTVQAIKKHLMHNGLLYRYKNHDDFGKPESAFTICTFWMIRALFVTGKQEEALNLFRQLLSYANHLMLYSEDLDFDTKEQLGNFPQAYSHLALINTALLFTEEKGLSQFLRP
ncbi:MAG: glycoside hydrolase family 15 protein [Bacteroidales bacterium]